jgi:hypothetical protein
MHFFIFILSWFHSFESCCAGNFYLCAQFFFFFFFFFLHSQNPPPPSISGDAHRGILSTFDRIYLQQRVALEARDNSVLGRARRVAHVVCVSRVCVNVLYRLSTGIVSLELTATRCKTTLPLCPRRIIHPYSPSNRGAIGPKRTLGDPNQSSKLFFFFFFFFFFLVYLLGTMERK